MTLTARERMGEDRRDRVGRRERRIKWWEGCGRYCIVENFVGGGGGQIFVIFHESAQLMTFTHLHMQTGLNCENENKCCLF